MDDSKLILKKIDELSNKIDSVESSLGSRINSLAHDVNGIKQDVDGIKLDVNGLKQDVNGLKQDVDGIKHDVNGIKLQIENEILPNISVIAEGHSILERKLDEATIMKTEHENMKLIITHHDTVIRDIKDRIGIA